MVISKQDLDGVVYLMDNVINDNGVPRNIRKSVSDAKEAVSKEGNEVNLTSATYLLDECLNDINMPMHSRSELMEIISELERLKEETK
ncbi:UPF0147 family protein [archaeon]